MITCFACSLSTTIAPPPIRCPRWLPIWGHDVRRAYDGVTGLALAAAFRPDVLLFDMLMPDVSGFEVARQVRRQDRLKHCFIIAVTGRTDAPHRSQCYEAGVDLFLIKPVAPADMQTLLGLESEHVRRSSKQYDCWHSL